MAGMTNNMKTPKRKKIVRKDDFIPRRNMECVLDALNRSVEFHRTNQNDPYNIGTAVMVAVSEVRDAFKAYI